jgi:hypothetical protein
MINELFICPTLLSAASSDEVVLLCRLFCASLFTGYCCIKGVGHVPTSSHSGTTTCTTACTMMMDYNYLLTSDIQVELLTVIALSLVLFPLLCYQYKADSYIQQRNSDKFELSKINSCRKRIKQISDTRIADLIIQSSVKLG